MMQFRRIFLVWPAVVAFDVAVALAVRSIQEGLLRGNCEVIRRLSRRNFIKFVVAEYITLGSKGAAGKQEVLPNAQAKVITKASPIHLPAMANLIASEIGPMLKTPAGLAQSKFLDLVSLAIEQSIFAPIVFLGLVARLAVAWVSNDGDHVLFVCLQNGELLGTAEVSLQPLDCDGSFPIGSLPLIKRAAHPGTPLATYVSNIIVKKEGRRQGIGRALLQRCETHALSRFSGPPVSHLHVNKDNFAALSLYQNEHYVPLLSAEDERQLINSALKWWEYDLAASKRFTPFKMTEREESDRWNILRSSSTDMPLLGIARYAKPWDNTGNMLHLWKVLDSP